MAIPTEAELKELRTVAYSAAATQLPPSGRHEAEEVAQDALLDYVAYATTHEVDVPEALMRVIAQRRTSKYRAAWQKRRGGDDPRLIAILGEDDADADGEGMGHHVQGEVPANNHSFERFEIDDALRWAITQLQPKYRVVAELTFLDSSVSPRFLQHRRESGEVAELLGIAEGTVRNRLSTARSMLADLLRED